MIRLFDDRPDSIIGELPAFLKRTPGDVGPIRKPRRKAWRMTPAMKAAIEREVKQRAEIFARGEVRIAVTDGADTLGKIRKATGLDNRIIRAALRFHCKARHIWQAGKRYRMTGRRP